MTHRQPHEPVSYQRVWSDGFAEAAYRFSPMSLQMQLDVHAAWDANPGPLTAATHVRLQSGALVIVKPRRRP